MVLSRVLCIIYTYQAMTVARIVWEWACQSVSSDARCCERRPRSLCPIGWRVLLKDNAAIVRWFFVMIFSIGFVRGFNGLIVEFFSHGLIGLVRCLICIFCSTLNSIHCFISLRCIGLMFLSNIKWHYETPENKLLILKACGQKGTQHTIKPLHYSRLVVTIFSVYRTTGPCEMIDILITFCNVLWWLIIFAGVLQSATKHRRCRCQ